MNSMNLYTLIYGFYKLVYLNLISVVQPKSMRPYKSYVGIYNKRLADSV